MPACLPVVLIILLCSADRRFVTQEASIETYSVPLDVKVEVMFGLLLCVLGSIIANTHGLQNIDYLWYWQSK